MLISLLAAIALSQEPQMPPNWIDVPIEDIAIEQPKQPVCESLVVIAEDK